MPVKQISSYHPHMRPIIFLITLFFVHSVMHAQRRPTKYDDRMQIIRTNIETYFRDTNTHHYLETDSVRPGENRYSFLWPLCGLVQAANEWESFSGKRGMLDSVMAQIAHYYDPSPPAPGYGSYIVKEKKEDRFYDDNQWIGIACMDAYERTRYAEYLQQARMIYRFMMTGFDTVAGGGLYWKEGDHSTKNTCSNGPGVILALKMYQVTAEQSLLDTAILLYEWTKMRLLSPQNVYYDNIKLPSREVDTRTYTYNTGTMLQSSVMLYRITRDKRYLDHARALAKGSLKRFYKAHRFPSHYWFNVVLLRGYLELYRVDDDKGYIKAMKKYANRIWRHETNARGLVGTKRRKELIDQAAVLELYARLAYREKSR